MHATTSADAGDQAPAISPDLAPPTVCGPAWLARRIDEGYGLDDLLTALRRPAVDGSGRAAAALDESFAYALRFRASQAAALQAQALDGCAVFRIPAASGARPPLRLLAVMAPGGFWVNTPLDFITAHLDVQLDLLFVRPGERLPKTMPDHDVAFFAVSESDPCALRRLAPLFRSWPRPALNDPTRTARLSRDSVAAGLAGLPGVLSPWAIRLGRGDLSARAHEIAADGPALVRPAGSHAGRGLELAPDAAALLSHLEAGGDDFFVSRFVDYRGSDGMFRKFRIALIQGRPFLCHMAISEHWMIHYLSAGMDVDAERRREEAHAMAAFDRAFAVRHAEAIASIHRWTGLDYVQLDCAEAPDGRLLVFEADTAAIVHLMDAPDLFPYKVAPMRRLFAAFERMLRDAAGRVSPSPPPWPGA